MSELIEAEVQRALETKLHALEAEAALVRSVLPSKAAGGLADELRRLLIRAADTAEELATLGPPSPALLELKTRLADAFLSLSAAADG